jgi:hypothetical protein
MLEVYETICYQAIPYHFYWFGLACRRMEYEFELLEVQIRTTQQNIHYVLSPTKI